MAYRSTTHGESVASPGLMKEANVSQLVKCVTCHGRVSTNAHFCPHCGEVEFSQRDPSGPIELPESKPDKRRIMARTAVITFAVVGFLAMVLYPPWAEERWKVSLRNEKVNIPIEQVDRHYLGHGYLLSNQWSQPRGERARPPGAMFEETSYHINLPVLLLQWLALLVPTFIVLILLRDKPQFPERFSTQSSSAAEEQPVLAGKRSDS
jgi:hypothetical protein